VAGVPEARRRRTPPVLVALVVTAVLTGVWLLSTVPNQPACDGPLCGLVEGWEWGLALIGWPVVFLVTWIAASLIGRIASRRDGESRDGSDEVAKPDS
jgi:hypothetical protein